MKIQTRAEWGAAPCVKTCRPMGKPTRITVHHSGEVAHEVGAAAVWVKSIQLFHVKKKGWADIGYHFVLGMDGSVWEGRPCSMQGAHAASAGKNENRGNIGICLLGDVGQTPAQRAALFDLLDSLCDQHALTKIFKHGELIDTDCPGPVVGRWVDEYRISKGIRWPCP